MFGPNNNKTDFGFIQSNQKPLEVTQLPKFSDEKTHFGFITPNLKPEEIMPPFNNANNTKHLFEPEPKKNFLPPSHVYIVMETTDYYNSQGRPVIEKPVTVCESYEQAKTFINSRRYVVGPIVFCGKTEFAMPPFNKS